MGRKLEWELSGKSDVPQKMAEARNSVDAFSRASEGISRKFKDAFKDIALGFIAPMILVQKAIGFITDRIEEAKRKAQEANDFAKEEESKKYAGAGGREAALQAQERKAEEEKKKKGSLMSFQGYYGFLTQDERGKKMLEEEAAKNALTKSMFERGSIGGAAQVLLQSRSGEGIKKRIDEILQPDVAARQAAEDAKKSGDKAKDATAKTTGPEVGSNVVGVGMSPQLEAMRQQTDLLTSIDMTLRGIVNAGIHPSSANLTEKGQVGSQAPSGFLFGYTQILGSRISR